MPRRADSEARGPRNMAARASKLACNPAVGKRVGHAHPLHSNSCTPCFCSRPPRLAMHLGIGHRASHRHNDQQCPAPPLHCQRPKTQRPDRMPSRNARPYFVSCLFIANPPQLIFEKVSSHKQSRKSGEICAVPRSRPQRAWDWVRRGVRNLCARYSDRPRNQADSSTRAISGGRNL